MTNTIQSVRKAIQKPISVVMASAYLNAAQTGLSGNVWNKITLDKVIYDAGSNFDTANHKFVAPISGFYRLHGIVHFAFVVSAKRYLVALYQNGIAIKLSYQHAALAIDLSVAVSTELFLKQNDYIELYAQPEVGGGVNTVEAVNGTVYTALEVRLVTKEGIRQ